MPFFKTNKNLFVDWGEHFDSNWMDSDSLILPPKTKWTYDREMTIDDVNVWELIHESNYGVYAAWDPYAEFYMIKPMYWMTDNWTAGVGQNHAGIEIFYGPKASQKVYSRCKELGINLPIVQHWVEEDEKWLY